MIPKKMSAVVLVVVVVVDVVVVAVVVVFGVRHFVLRLKSKKRLNGKKRFPGTRN